MFNKLFKPKWQHQDASIRKTAVETMHDQETLAKVAAEDHDSAVREAAVNQLKDLGSLFQLRKQNTLTKTADQRIAQLILTQTKVLHYSPELGEFIIEHATPELLTRLVDEAGDERIRQTATECCQNPETLLRLSTQAQSSETRLTAAKKLKDETSLREAIKILGKRDKRVTQQLRENLNRLLEQKSRSTEIDNLILSLNKLGQTEHWQHDQARLQKLQQHWEEHLRQLADKTQQLSWQAASAKLTQRLTDWKSRTAALQPVLEAKQSLCELIEGFAGELSDRNYLRKPEAAEFTATFDSFSSDWASLSELPPEKEYPLEKQFNNGLLKCRELIQTLSQNARASEQFERLIDLGNKLLKKKSIPTLAVEKLNKDWENLILPKNKTLSNSLLKDFSNLNKHLQLRLTEQTNSREKGLSSIQQWLNSLDKELSENKISHAPKLFLRIEQTLRELPEVPRNQQKEIGAALAEMRPRLRELEGWRHWSTDRAREELVAEASALIDAEISVKERAKSIKGLRERWKQLGKMDPKSGHTLWKKFDQACTQAYEPVKNHKAEEQDARNKNLEKRETICKQLEKISSETDWKSPDWRDIDKHLNKLRNQWRSCEPVNRKNWNAINERFNNAVSELDGQLEDERRISYNRRLVLIEKIESIKDNQDLVLAIQTAKDAQKSWQPTVMGKRADEQRLWKSFRAAIDHIFEREKARRNSDSEALNTLLQEKQSICESVEQLARLEGDSLISAQSESHKLLQQWDNIPEIRNKHYKKIEKRFQQALKSFEDRCIQQQQQQNKQQIFNLLNGKCTANDATPNPEQLNLLLLELEIILEVDSPDDQANARMQLQVERLADAMSSGSSQDTHDEVTILSKKVCEQLRADADIPDLAKRIAAISSAIELQESID